MSRMVECRLCKGNGATEAGRCRACGGIGKIKQDEIEVGVNPATVKNIRIVCRCQQAFIFGIPAEIAHLTMRKECPNCARGFLYINGGIIREDGTALELTEDEKPLQMKSGDEWIN